jgi:deferrochelatase/peroxidase EfeB
MAISETPDFHDSDLQGDVLPGFRVRKDPSFRQHFLFFSVVDAERARRGLGQLVPYISSSKDVKRDEPAAVAAEPAVNVAFTWSGLEALELDARWQQEFDGQKAFKEGLQRRTKRLPDLLGSSASWQFGDGELHVLVNVGGVDAEGVRRTTRRIEAQILADGFRPRGAAEGALRTRDAEVFGFADGLSQPLVEGYHQPVHAGPQQSLATSVASYPTEVEVEEARRRAIIENSDFSAAMRKAEVVKLEQWLRRRTRRAKSRASMSSAAMPQFSAAGRPLLPLNQFVLNPSRPDNRAADFTSNGSFMVWIRFVQHRKRFRKHCTDMAARLSAAWQRPVTPDQAAALMVGRRRNGTSMVVRPLFNRSNGLAPDEAFRYLPHDPDGEACPLASHARKMNPRTMESLRHAIIRRGIPFKSAADEGLLFVCYQSSIEDQYEKLQRYWANRAYKPERNASPDPLIGQVLRAPGRHIEIRNFKRGGSTHINVHNDWIEPTGGLYLFVPSIRSVRMLAGDLSRRPPY